METVIVTIPASLDFRKKSWRKRLERINRDCANGYAFEGPWLRAGELAEVPVGTYIMGYDEPGSMKNWRPAVHVWRVESADTLTPLYEFYGDVHMRSWALACRDAIAALIETPTDAATEAPPAAEGAWRLENVPTEALWAELTRRGVPLLAERDARGEGP